MSADMIQCPGCGSTYDVPPILLEKGELRVRCPACRRRFTLRRKAVERSVAPPAPDAEIPSASVGSRRQEPAPTSVNAERLERRAKRLAKALVEQILRGRTAKRDQALAEGRLILEFGPEIQKIWRIYVEKVGAEHAKRSPQFKKALNEILADGNEVF